VAISDLYSTAAFFVKTSLFIVYLRFFQSTETFRWLLHGGNLVCGLFYAATLIGYTVLATPGPNGSNTVASWTDRATDKNRALMQVSIAQGVFGVLIDAYLLVLPMFAEFKTKLSGPKRAGIYVAYGIGAM
jgi:hypothetical protein